jgi:microcystin-dependent protein
MADPFIGEIRMFAGNYAPAHWAFCNGQLMPIMQQTTLFALLGTIYGGDGRTTFALPDMRGRIPIHAGRGPGLTQRHIGERGGYEVALVTFDELAPHSHTLMASANEATVKAPAGKVLGKTGHKYYSSGPAGNGMNEHTIGNTGSDQSHNNMMPSLCINFIIALEGVFPPRA